MSRDPAEGHGGQGAEGRDGTSSLSYLLPVGFAFLDAVCTFDCVPVVYKHKHRRTGRRRKNRENIKQELTEDLEGYELCDVVGGYSEAD